MSKNKKRYKFEYTVSINDKLNGILEVIADSESEAWDKYHNMSVYDLIEGTPGIDSISDNVFKFAEIDEFGRELAVGSEVVLV